jgi:phosphatidylserine/phosphatidylglycerophosphate/cardiolipin synthase-like enzyme
MTIDAWLLTAAQRGNPDTGIDRRRSDRTAWTHGNDITVLAHGATYFTALLDSLRATRAGDMVMFTDWRCDPDEALDAEGTDIAATLCDAARRKVRVKGLLWRSHLDLLHFSSVENRRLGRDIEAAGGECLLDMRVRPGGSHHQKIVIIRHPDRPGLDVAYAGGIDLCHSRRDDSDHHGDPQPQPMASVYGSQPPWHDIQLAVRGPAVGDVEATFRERWNDPSPLTHSPLRWGRGKIESEDFEANRLPTQLPDPAPRGTQTVQVLRTYPYRWRAYPFARRGERSIARAYTKALARATKLIYLEDQYLWSVEVAAVFAKALRRQPDLRLIAVVPAYPDTDGPVGHAQVLGRRDAMTMLRDAGGDRVAVYAPENHDNVPVYVHAKLCVIDDVWSCVGSDNLNMRSWTHDSELACAIMDGDGGTATGRALRMSLHREHLDRALGDDADLIDPVEVFAAYRDAAKVLDAWHDDPAGTPRPPGRLRTYRPPPLRGWQKLIAKPLYHLLCDPDGRPPRMRRGMDF